MNSPAPRRTFPIVEMRRRPSLVRRFCAWIREELRPANNPRDDEPAPALYYAILAFLLLTGGMTIAAVFLPV